MVSRKGPWRAVPPLGPDPSEPLARGALGGYTRAMEPSTAWTVAFVAAAVALAILAILRYRKSPTGAAELGDVERLGEFLAEDPGLVKKRLARGATLLHKAGSKEVAALLLSRGAELEAVDEDGSSPLHYAATRGEPDLVGYLVSRGARVNVFDEEGSTPLDYARNTHSDRAEEILIKAGGFAFGGSPPELVRVLVEQGREAVERLLAADPAAVKKTDEVGITPLHEAAGVGCVPVMELLLERGADLEAPDDHGYTPLHIACMESRPESVKFLLGRGARADARSKDGTTPAECGDGEIEELFVKPT